MLSVWLAPLPPPRPALDQDTHCDVVVVGAGLCGASAALRLAEQGLDVVWLEARQVAESASGRNAGFILQGTAERYDRAVAVMGRTRARRVHALSLDNHDAIEAAVQTHGIACGYRRCGSLQLASSDLEQEELRVSAALLNEDGFHAELVAQAQLPPVFQRSGHQVGVLLPRDGELDPAAFVRGLASAAQAAGARLYERSPVTHLDASTPGQVHAQTAHGTVHASLAVVATNARAPELLPTLQDHIDPVRGQMLATGPLPRLFDLPVYANHGYDYWRQDDQGRVVLGGWRNLDPGAEVGHDEVLHDDIQARMTRFIESFDFGAPVQIQDRWSGIMGFSTDGLPLVGPAPGRPGAVVGAGFTGHGFGFAMLAGQALADLVTQGAHPMCQDLDPRRLT
jgi:glycine/D-amino acid oxidase-like deaminating enzyme